MVPVILGWLVVLLIPTIGHTTTYYVATNGSNSNPGTSIELPYLTIDHAVDVMVAGDTTYVRGGTYNESGIRFGVTGTQALPIKLLNYPNETPILSCTGQSLELDSIRIRHNSGSTNAIGWITIEGLTITNCNDGIKGENIHNSTFRKLDIYNNDNQGLLITGAHDNLFTQNLVHHNGDFLNCVSCDKQHGLYASGKRWTITNNVFYDNLGFGIQQNGSSSANNTTTTPDAEFRGAQDWIIANNTFAYTSRKAGIVVWGSTCTNFRIENNIFYENAVLGATSDPQGVSFVSATGVTGASIRNNHFYASGSGGRTGIGPAPPSSYTNSGNVTNVSVPGFVEGGSNLLPEFPDFSLVVTSPAIGMARANEFPRNASLTVGAFDTVSALPTGSITANIITLIFPMSSAVPIQNLSTVGVTVTCTGSACPGSPTVSGVSRVTNTDSHVATTISGITANACEAANQTWTQSYSSTTGSWSGNDHLGPYPGLHQKIFSFTNVAIDNQCTGSGPTGYPAGYHIYYKFDENTGTNANDESANNLDCTLTNGATWGTGKSGSAMVVAAGSTQHCTIPWGNGVNPSTQSITVFVPVNITVGAESAQHYVVGPSLGTNQRAYICARSGTWRISIQSTSCSSSAASNLAVTSGWNELTLRFDSGTDTATLYKGTTTGTGGATLPYTSFTFNSHWKLGQVDTLTSTGATYDEFLLYLSLEDPADLVAGFNATVPTPSGTFDQTTVQAQGTYLVSGSPENLVALGAAKKVVVYGSMAWVFQIHCTNVADCAQTAFRLAYRKNGAGTWQQVPDTETADGIYLWGTAPDSLLNTGETTARLSGSCTVTNGVTLLATGQIPSVDLPQDGCVMLRWIVRVGNVAGDYFELRVETEGGVAFTGSYTLARIDVIPTQADGMGF